MVIDDLDLIGVVITPFEANSPLVVHPDAVLTCPAADQLLKAVARWNLKILKRFCRVQHDQFSKRRLLSRPGETSRGLPLKDLPGLRIAEAPDHIRSITRDVINVKRYSGIP